MTAHNSGVSTKRGTFFYESIDVIFGTDLRVFASWVKDVCEHHRGSAKDIIFEGYAFIHGDVVLNFHIISDSHIISDVYILSEYAEFTDFCARLDVREVPDFCSFSDFDAVIDDGVLVYHKGFF